MKLNEAEMRMAYQIEATNQSAALNEIYMTCDRPPPAGNGEEALHPGAAGAGQKGMCKQADAAPGKGQV